MSTVSAQTIEFLRTNPGEQLDAECVSIKFGCDRRQVHTLLAAAVKAELLHQAEDLESGDIVYSLGSRGLAVGSEAQAQHKRGRSPLEWMNLDNVKIDKGMPIPSRTRSRSNEWQQLLERLELGDSFLLPTEANKSIISAITTCHKNTRKKFVRRVLSEGVRVWRTA